MYIDYALNDVQVTWECYVALRDKFNEFRAQSNSLGQIISEAGLGKGYLKEMGIVPWRGMQPDFPNALSGIILSATMAGVRRCTFGEYSPGCSTAISGPCIPLCVR